jgi:hypothetical protein
LHQHFLGLDLATFLSETNRTATIPNDPKDGSHDHAFASILAQVGDGEYDADMINALRCALGYGTDGPNQERPHIDVENPIKIETLLARCTQIFEQPIMLISQQSIHTKIYFTIPPAQFVW